MGPVQESRPRGPRSAMPCRMTDDRVRPGALFLPSQGDPLEPRTVLIVEDDPGSLDIFTTILRHGGYQVIPAQTGADGLQMARARASACWTTPPPTPRPRTPR